MGNQYVFQRYELKYILSLKQYIEVVREIEYRMRVDEYRETTIQSLCFDTDTYLLIHNSIERPCYKKN